MLSVPPSMVVRYNRKHVQVIGRLHMLDTSNHRTNVQKAFKLLQTYKVSYYITAW